MTNHVTNGDDLAQVRPESLLLSALDAASFTAPSFRRLPCQHALIDQVLDPVGDLGVSRRGSMISGQARVVP
ncbi:hypothetical protein KDA82_07305 [Streptomyces daliensis]|uniref:Uncharacterized protein n=1 Tax=Streptomyces daliensis TaxID=299421 RepID=A0A8T4IKJ7_9ACTN|nr:hypothetical protein [Streptomyces daliensis]